MSETPCPRCRKATTDGLLCHPCTSLYTRARKDIIKFTPDLRTAWMRQDVVARSTNHHPGTGLEQPEPAAAAPVAVLLRTRDARIALPATPLPVNLDAGALYREAIHWLTNAYTDARGIRGLVDAAALVDQARRLAARIEQAIDRRDPELFLGPCDAPDTIHVDTHEVDGVVTFEVSTTDRVCGVDLYAQPGDVVVECHACGYEYRVTDRRAWMLAAVRNLLERPVVIAEALTSLDMPITAKTLDDWISRDKKLHAQGRPRRDGLPLILEDPVYNDRGKPLYLVGAVIDRIEAIRARAGTA